MMYSVFYEDQGSAAAAGLNLRASWLAGRRVYGPVVFAGSGIMRGAVRLLRGGGGGGDRGEGDDRGEGRHREKGGGVMDGLGC